MIPRKVILRAFVCLVLAMIPLPDLENELYDVKSRILKSTYFQRPDKMLIIEISKDDFEELQRRFGGSANAARKAMLGPWREKFESLRTQFFWDDGVYEKLIARVLQHNPRKFLISFFFNESMVLPQENSRLQKLARDPKVLWASQFDLENKLAKPAPELTGTENYGFNNLYPDSDGVVRRAHLIYHNHMSLPFRALIDGTESLTRKMPLTESFLIRFSGATGQIPSCKAIELFDAPEKCGPLNDRYVIFAPANNSLIGASLFRTPVGYMGKAEILANILLTAENESAYLPVSPFLLLLFVFGHILAISAAVLRRDGLQLTTGAMLLCAESALALAAMRFLSLQIPLLPFIFGTISSYVAFVWLKLARQEEKRWQAEKKAQYLRELDELKSNFLSLMSHDLKTPIAKVQALTERLAREAQSITPQQKEILIGIQRSNEELGQYILSILNFQRIESQELKPHKKSHDINVIIEEIAQRQQTLAMDKGVEIRLELEPMFAAEFDEHLIRQVLNNLVDNAIKYNSKGTVVTISSKDLHDSLSVTVSDNGIGMEKEQLDKLFKKFSRSEKGTSERVKGTGLGLYLAKYFIELHGGKIEVESKAGEGTLFRFTLPIA